MSVLNRKELSESPLADLHQIAAELGVEGYRAMRKDALIAAVLGVTGAPDEGPEADEAPAAEEPPSSAEPDDEDEDDDTSEGTSDDTSEGTSEGMSEGTSEDEPDEVPA